MAKPPSYAIALGVLSLPLFLLLLRPPFLFYEGRPPNVNISTELERRLGILRVDIPRYAKIGLINLSADEVRKWRTQEVKLRKTIELLEWSHLFPEWIDEEEEMETPSCPDLAMPDFSKYDEVDVVVARLPCRYPAAGWARHVSRLRAHLAAAHFASKRARRDSHGRVKLVFLSKCQPMMELFRLADLVHKEGDYWFYLTDVNRLRLKVSLPVGSCRLPSPPGEQYFRVQKEAYVTVLHSSQAYVCGAIVLAHSIRRSGSNRDLVLLHDRTISNDKLTALAGAGWKLRIIDRIRNPHGEKNSYNEYNYSKLRIWELTDYDKVVFLDADALVLRNIDYLFRWPEMSAAGNDGFLFNSGVMVVEPSNATFSSLMSLRGEIVSYNGGDQGFLNEAFVWWHRLPRKVNTLKVYLQAMTWQKVDVVHFLGQKPWFCYRDHDCNGDVKESRIYASEEAHRVWWSLHDGVEPELKRFCRMPAWRKSMITEERRAAEGENEDCMAPTP